jgi:hypothetical protein
MLEDKRSHDEYGGIEYGGLPANSVLLTETTAFAGLSASTSWAPPLPRSRAVGEGSMAARINH